MTNKSEPENDGMPEWYNPFEEPRTFPGNWDLSSLTTKREPAPDSESEEPSTEYAYRLTVCLN
jgi:hypothetical protein